MQTQIVTLTVIAVTNGNSILTQKVHGIEGDSELFPY